MNLATTLMTKILLLVGAVVAIGIALAILFATDLFYAGMDFDTGNNINLANELKAPMGLLLVAGVVMLAALFREEMLLLALGIGGAVFLSYGAARFLSMLIDGMPGGSLVTAAWIEVIIGVMCVAAFLFHYPSES